MVGYAYPATKEEEMSEQPASAEDLVDEDSPTAPYVDEPNGSTEDEEEGED